MTGRACTAGNSRKQRAAIGFAVLAAIFLVSFIAALATSSAGAYALSTIALVFAVGLGCVEFLDLKIGGSQLTLERQIHTVQEENKRLKEATEALLRSYYVLMDVSQYPFMGGPTIAHYRIINEYLEPVSDLFPSDLQAGTLAKVQGLSKTQTEDEVKMSPLQRQAAAGLASGFSAEITG